MVMWLVTAVSKEQRAAIFDYFKNPSMEPGKSVKPAPGQMGPGGASSSPINLGGGLDAPKTSLQKTDKIGATVMTAPAQAHRPQERRAEGRGGSQKEAREEAARRADAGSQGSHRQEPGAGAVQGSAAAGHHARRPAHPDRRRAEPPDVRHRQLASQALHRRDPAEVTTYLQHGAEPAEHHGHTDATPYAGLTGFTNWDLSTDRANCRAPRAGRCGAATRAQSRAWWAWARPCCSTSENPRSAVNRRISIVVMTQGRGRAGASSRICRTPSVADQPSAIPGEPAQAEEAITDAAPASPPVAQVAH